MHNKLFVEIPKEKKGKSENEKIKQNKQTNNLICNMLELKDFIGKVENFRGLKASEQIDYFAYYFSIVKNTDYFVPTQISEAFSLLRLTPYSNIPNYLSYNTNKKIKGKKVKFIKTKRGYQLEGNYELDLRSKIKLEEEIPFINYKIDTTSLTWKPSDIPFTNSKIRKNAEFFATLYYLFYHLENSIRKFLLQRLTSILGGAWESEIISKVDLAKAFAIRKEVNLSEMLPERGDNILYYCMWDDYAKIISIYPSIFKIVKEKDEILAHLNSLGKIRNAIAHNAVTIPKEYQDELTLFLAKYIKILRNNE